MILSNLRRALEMGVAAYQFHRAHALTIRESLAGAYELFILYLK